jgi:hypothetical protein
MNFTIKDKRVKIKVYKVKVCIMKDKKLKVVRKPKDNKDLGCIIDEYYDQYMEAKDDPRITIHVGLNEYDVNSPGEDRYCKSIIEELRTHAEFLNKCADWVEYKRNNI